MQYLVLLSALMSLATVVMAQDVDTALDDNNDALPLDRPLCSESVSAAASGMNEKEEVFDW